MLAEKDYSEAADMLRCPMATIKAVAEVESSGSGMLPDGRPVIRFESHIFSRQTVGEYDASHPDISTVRWVKGLVKGGIAEWDRLGRAAGLDRTAALKACSWGMFQIMGFNFEPAGYRTIQSFVNGMYAGEAEHLRAFCRLVIAWGLDDELRSKNWAKFASGYNGPGYAANKYDSKLAAAYAKHGGI